MLCGMGQVCATEKGEAQNENGVFALSCQDSSEKHKIADKEGQGSSVGEKQTQQCAGETTQEAA